LVLRFYCDLNVDQAAQVLGCSPGTVKSQTARALGAARRTLGPQAPTDGGGQPAAMAEFQTNPEGSRP
jgi:DNA-directed RNA polymerase specialized sigma24 family protein